MDAIEITLLRSKGIRVRLFYEFIIIEDPFLKFKLLKIMLPVCIDVGPNFTPIRVWATYILNACKACNSPLSRFLAFDTVYFT